MSKLEELIQKYCPDGVEYVRLKDICIKTDTIKWKNATELHKYIDLSSVDIPTHSILSTTTIDKDTAPSRAQQIVLENDVIFATTRPTQMRLCLVPADYNGEICSTGYCVLRPNTDCIIPKYLLFALSVDDFKSYLYNNQTMGNYPSISNNLLKEYEIPLPPLPVQQEVVNVLEELTRLQLELETKLLAEIQTRQQQYNYYRELLLSFKKK